ncbi:hypothetical protein K1X76_12735 [bacterium]|nr:hypothetical protein [bacterium]
MKKIISVLALCLFAACSSSSTSSNNLTVYGAGSSEEAAGSISVREMAITRDDLTPVGSPTVINMTLYGFYISPNTDCSDAVLVGGDGETAVEKDFAGNPVLFETEVDEGSYPCVIMVLSDVIGFVPDDDAVTAWPGVCDADTEESFDIYRTDSGEVTPWVDLEGNDVTATGTFEAPGADVVTVFASTDPDAVIAATGANEFQVGELATELVVPGQTTFYFDASNGILGDGRCAIENATVGFR